MSGNVQAGVMDALNTQAAGDIHQHGAVVEIDDIFRPRLSHVQRQAVNIDVGLADMDEAGNDEDIKKLLEVKLADAMFGEFTPFVADGDDLEVVLDF